VSSTQSTPGRSTLAGLTLGALGVVYGDIGTSPLYALKEVFGAGHVPLTDANILGILSLVFWTLTVVVSLKYVVLVMRANNNGEGGTMALLALAGRALRAHPRLRTSLLMMGILGAAMFYGDGVITPAISVLSAVEGLELATPALKSYVVPLTLAILFGLYALQRHGTGAVGKLFGPITLLWFIAIGWAGAVWVVKRPDVLWAMNPALAIEFGLTHGHVTFVVLGAVFLAVTGAEALYADMGHFGARPIRVAWFALVWPSLLLNYFGQGALLLDKPEAVENPFYLLAPGALLIPFVILATIATVIASQATISGTFSVTKQAIQLGYLPRMRMIHTSVHETGQIYLPAVNWAQYAAIVAAVLLFGSSSALASAYGIAVTTTMVLTTLMTFFVIRFLWNYPLWISLGSTIFFLIIEVIFLASNVLKVFQGGWFTLLIAAVLFTIMLTWKQGRRQLADKLREDAIDLNSFLEAVFVNPPTRVAGTAVFLAAEQGITPNALMHNLKHNRVLHEQNIFVTVKNHEVPWIGFDKRCEVESLGHCCWQVTLHFGFKNEPDVPEALAQLKSHGVQLEEMDTSYFLSRDIVIPTIGSGMALWREKLFASMHRNAAAAADFLHLPANRIVELGSKVEI
jgi:KUP system potassium uptake protein